MTETYAHAPRQFMEKSRTAGRQRKEGGLVELSVHLTKEQVEALRIRAEYNDNSLSAQVRIDVDKANRGFNGNL